MYALHCTDITAVFQIKSPSKELTVTIAVTYTPPTDFIRTSVEDYRAASGPVTLTCQVEGATGTVTYQWTSTCTHPQCFVLNSNFRINDQTLMRSFVRAGVDDGTHTCTATDSVGSTGTDSIVMNIVGMSECCAKSPLGRGGAES